jgi:hypothetical protein
MDAAAAAGQEFTAVFDQQITAAVKKKFQPDRTELFQRGVLRRRKLNCSESPAAGRVTVMAVLITVKSFIKQDTVLLYTPSPEQFHELTSALRVQPENSAGLPFLLPSSPAANALMTP